MSAEIVRTGETILPDNTRNGLIYFGIGFTAGVGIAVAYDKVIYHDLRADYDDKVERTEDLEATAGALALSSVYLKSEGLINEEAAIVMTNERTELVSEAREIKKDTPNIILEQWTWAGVGIIPGIALALGAWVTHRKWKKHRQQPVRQVLQ